MKRIRPQDARRALRMLWAGAKVHSHANGVITIEPVWSDKGNAGVLTRMHAAHMVETVLGLAAKKRRDD